MADTPKPAPPGLIAEMLAENKRTMDAAQRAAEDAFLRLAAVDLFTLRGPPLPEARRPERPMLEHPGSFDLGLERGPNDGGAPYRHVWLGEVCRQAVAIFRDEVLGRREIVRRYCNVYAGRHTRDLRQSVQGWQNAGNLLHYATRVGQVEQIVGADGEPRWRLLSREPVWVLEGRPERAVQARCLPPDEQAKRYALERRRAARALQTALTSADRTIPADIEDVLLTDPHAVITPAMVARGGLPEAFEGEQIAAARPTLQNWHRDSGFGIERLTFWVGDWRNLAYAARLEAQRRATARFFAPIPPEDADALGWL